MLGLPQSTEFNKRIPKQKFYEHMFRLFTTQEGSRASISRT